ncbi:DUF805 domain-containing protein [Shewanella submarina]|uniref:DUF805 domain-containing protein n=1 Tax=Shewanella submarina TaxID=2016376 RepID=A0ABV7GG32_9GAMM|nr:DUF805 domain-containing protein [Shewanella submarina]
MEFYLRGWRRCFDFSGRASRQEFWMFNLVSLIFAFLATVLDDIVIGYRFIKLETDDYYSATEAFVLVLNDVVFGPFYFIYITLAALPALAVMVRRLHDTGRTGWMLLLPLIPLIGTIWLLVLLLSRSQDSDNQYGVKPVCDEQDSRHRDGLVLLGVILILYGIGGHYVFATSDLLSIQYDSPPIHFAYIDVVYDLLTYTLRTLDLASLFGISLILLSLRSRLMKAIMFTLVFLMVAWVWVSYSSWFS